MRLQSETIYESQSGISEENYIVSEKKSDGRKNRPRKRFCKRGHENPQRTKHGACIPCAKLYRKETYERDREYRIKQAVERAKSNPDVRRDEQRAWRLGVSVSEVRAAIERSGKVCEACMLPLTHRTLCVDHDHKTGHVRGVLCRFCNALEGMLNKQPERVAQVQAYVARANTRLGFE